MNILIADRGSIPAFKYGGTERVIWSLGKSLVKMGHKITYLVAEGSMCDFADVLTYNPLESLAKQIPSNIDIVHFNYQLSERINVPYIVTMHGNKNENSELDINTVFVSKNHAERFGSESFVYNGLDWSEYSKPDFSLKRENFHFLANAAWRVKNVKGAIDVIKATPHERLDVLGGTRLNIKMGFRLTLSPRVSFKGMVGGEEKFSYMNRSKGLIFPVRWHEPFGLAITESLYFGCPVFGTPYGSLPELVTNEMGFLSNDKNELAEAIISSEFDRKRCHEYANDIFNSDRMAAAYLEKYSMVLNGIKLNEVEPTLKNCTTEKFLFWK